MTQPDAVDEFQKWHVVRSKFLNSFNTLTNTEIRLFVRKTLEAAPDRYTVACRHAVRNVLPLLSARLTAQLSNAKTADDLHNLMGALIASIKMQWRAIDSDMRFATSRLSGTKWCANGVGRGINGVIAAVEYSLNHVSQEAPSFQFLEAAITGLEFLYLLRRRPSHEFRDITDKVTVENQQRKEQTPILLHSQVVDLGERFFQRLLCIFQQSHSSELSEPRKTGAHLLRAVSSKTLTRLSGILRHSSSARFEKQAQNLKSVLDVEIKNRVSEGNISDLFPAVIDLMCENQAICVVEGNVADNVLIQIIETSDHCFDDLASYLRSLAGLLKLTLQSEHRWIAAESLMRIICAGPEFLEDLEALPQIAIYLLQMIASFPQLEEAAEEILKTKNDEDSPSRNDEGSKDLDVDLCFEFRHFIGSLNEIWKRQCLQTTAKHANAVKHAVKPYTRYTAESIVQLVKLVSMNSSIISFGPKTMRRILRALDAQSDFLPSGALLPLLESLLEIKISETASVESPTNLGQVQRIGWRRALKLIRVKEDGNEIAPTVPDRIRRCISVVLQKFHKEILWSDAECDGLGSDSDATLAPTFDFEPSRRSGVAEFSRDILRNATAADSAIADPAIVDEELAICHEDIRRVVIQPSDVDAEYPTCPTAKKAGGLSFDKDYLGLYSGPVLSKPSWIPIVLRAALQVEYFNANLCRILGAHLLKNKACLLDAGEVDLLTEYLVNVARTLLLTDSTGDSQLPAEQFVPLDKNLPLWFSIIVDAVEERRSEILDQVH